MSYSLYLKPTWRTRALETSLVWSWKIVLVLSLVLVVQSEGPYYKGRHGTLLPWSVAWRDDPNNGSEGRLVGKLTNETLWSFWRDYGRHFAFAAWRKQDVVWFMSVVCSWIHDKVAITSAWWTLTRVWVMLKMNKSAYKNFALAIIDYLSPP